MCVEEFPVNYILRARFKGRTAVYLKTNGERIIGDVFEIAAHESIDEMELLAAIVGDGDVFDGYIYFY